MNTFKKYPKLNLLFFLYISTIVLMCFTLNYISSNITEAFDTIERKLEIQESIEKQFAFNEFKNDVLNSIYYLFIIGFIGIKLLSFIKTKTDKENKRLNELEKTTDSTQFQN